MYVVFFLLYYFTNVPNKEKINIFWLLLIHIPFSQVVLNVMKITERGIYMTKILRQLHRQSADKKENIRDFKNRYNTISSTISGA